MTDAIKRIYATGNATSGSWNDAPLTMRSPPTQTEYHRADLSADLVRAGLAKAARAAFLHLVKDHGRVANQTANDIRKIADDPEAIAAIVAQVMEKEQ